MSHNVSGFANPRSGFGEGAYAPKPAHAMLHDVGFKFQLIKKRRCLASGVSERLQFIHGNVFLRDCYALAFANRLNARGNVSSAILQS